MLMLFDGFMALSSEQAKLASAKRWDRDPMGLDKAVKRLVRRAPALSEEQRATLRCVLDGAHDGDRKETISG